MSVDVWGCEPVGVWCDVSGVERGHGGAWGVWGVSGVGLGRGGVGGGVGESRPSVVEVWTRWRPGVD